MSTTIPSKPLRRYTDLPSLINILTNKKITLLNPKSWDDRNDSYFLSLYKEHKNLKTLLALCFSQTTETYHHWRVFSNGSSGVCIVFNKNLLLNSVKHISDVKCSEINYLSLQKIKNNKNISVENLPFVKRYGYNPEKEFRIIYESYSEDLDYLDVEIDINCIERILLSPWMDKNLIKSTEIVIKSISECSKIKIKQSTLISNEMWKSFGYRATKGWSELLKEN